MVILLVKLLTKPDNQPDISGDHIANQNNHFTSDKVAASEFTPMPHRLTSSAVILLLLSDPTMAVMPSCCHQCDYPPCEALVEFD